MNYPETLLGRMKPQDFLRRYWQKKPLLVRKAYPNMPRLVSPDEVAGLSCEPDLVSRVILEKGGKKPWEVRRGPFRPTTFAKLPKKNWTLLVNGIDRYIPAVHRLLDSFRFIPNWRIEDVMISYAVDRGNVGAHVDDFDVFLIQAEGRREWRIEQTPQLTDEFREGLDIKLLKKFRPDDTWVLEPGDMLYLPPRFAHHGIAKGDGCMTISVGFRAPRYSELLSSALGETFERLHDALRYSDPDLTMQRPGEISPASLKRVRSALESTLPSGTELALWFGRLVTQSRDARVTVGTDGVTGPMLTRYVNGGGELLRNEGSRLAYYSERPDSAYLFVDGEIVPLTGSGAKQVADSISDGTVLTAPALKKLLKNKLASRLVLELIARGVLYIPDTSDSSEEDLRE